MIVKFNKKQIKALASLESRANALFNELQQEKPHLYREDERKNTVRCFVLGFLEHIAESGEFYVEGR